MAVLGSLAAVGLTWFVFHGVVSTLALNSWVSAVAVLTALRLVDWWRFRRADFSLRGRDWLRHATTASLIGGILWGLGSLFLFPPGQITYQFTFMIILVMMAIAAMFSYAPHYPTYIAYFVPSVIPGVVVLELTGSRPQEGMGLGMLLLMAVVLLSLNTYNRMFVESMRLRLQKLDLVAQLTAQKDVAEAANLAKSRFLAAASHDLRQPIHALNLYLGAFGQMELPRRADIMLGKVRQCAQIMDVLFRTLLDISELDAGAVRPQIGAFPLAPLFARARLEFEPQARAKGLELRVKPCAEHVRSDPVLIERILRNLISNAIRYTERGRIVVGCRPQGSSVRICVYDTGIGIAPHDQALVFEEFYQVSNRERDRSKGLGLGLAIVDRLTRLLEAPLVLRSNPGRGSLFAFALARAEEVAPPRVHMAPRGNDSRNLAGTFVVVVDDEELILDAAQNLLEQWGCTVVTAVSRLQALERLAGSPRPPDVIICDYRLRDQETGIVVVEAIRNEFNGDIPALLLTGETDPAQIRQISASGVAVLHKPLREDELSDAIYTLHTRRTVLQV